MSKKSTPTYRELVKTAIVDLKEAKGSSRGAIKQHILANNKLAEPERAGGRINQAIRVGVEKGVFVQPKGPSGTVKLASTKSAKSTKSASSTKGSSKAASGKSTVKAKLAPAKTSKTTTKSKVTKAAPAKKKSTKAAPAKAKSTKAAPAKAKAAKAAPSKPSKKTVKK